MKKMPTIPIFIYCSKNTFLRVLGPRLQIEIFDIPDYFFQMREPLLQRFTPPVLVLYIVAKLEEGTSFLQWVEPESLSSSKFATAAG